MKKWRCEICQEEFEGDEPPIPCPVCGTEDEGDFTLMEED